MASAICLWLIVKFNGYQVGVLLIRAHDIPQLDGQSPVLKGDNLHHQTGEAGPALMAGEWFALE